MAYRDYQLHAVEQVDRPPAGVLPGVRQAGRQGIARPPKRGRYPSLPDRG